MLAPFAVGKWGVRARTNGPASDRSSAQRSKRLVSAPFAVGKWGDKARTNGPTSDRSTDVLEVYLVNPH